ncbi:MAG TPA: hypothetical protein VFZ37_00215 [Jiangellaceae bacterium]
MEWLIGLLGGVFGGNAAGAAAKENSLGRRGNSIIGAIGGGAAGAIIQGLMDTGVDFGAVVSQLVGGGTAGVLVTALAIMIKNRSHGDGRSGGSSAWQPE